MATTIKRRSSKGIGTTPTQIGGYAAPSVTTGVYVTGLVIANTSNGSVNASADVYDGTNHVNLCLNTPIPIGGSINLASNSNRLALNSGDQVFVTSSAAGSLDVNMSVSEIQ